MKWNVWSKRAASFAIFLALVALTWWGQQQTQSVIVSGSSFQSQPRTKWTVCLDAGHGGVDPGKVGVNQALEKDVNLQITRKLQKFLEAADVEVVLTRTSDSGLYDENESNKKVQDMKNRVRKIEEYAPDLVVSIHQNSYHEEYVHGAQIFYYQTSTDGETAASYLQDALRATIDPQNKRVPKANDSYYLLKKTSAPIVIAECGFLSNRAEAQKLVDEIYQEKVAWALHLGILRYLNSLHMVSGSL